MVYKKHFFLNLVVSDTNSEITQSQNSLRKACAVNLQLGVFFFSALPKQAPKYVQKAKATPFFLFYFTRRVQF